MTDYIISTDTGSDLTAQLYQKYNVIPIRMEYEIDGEIFEDAYEPEKLKEFYDKMRNGAVPKTTQLNVSKLCDFFEGLAKQGKPIMYISLGAGISGSYNNAVNAANEVMEKYPDVKIYVINSSVASLGGGALCIMASENRQNGLDIEQNVAALEAQKHNIGIYVTTKDLTYLYRGGRVSKTSAVLGNMLGINPIIKLDYEGHLIVCDKVRGEKNTFNRIEKLIEEHVINPKDNVLYVSHSDAYEKAEMLAKRYKEKFGFKDTLITNIGTIIGSHTGPGLVAVYFNAVERDKE